MKSIKIIPSYNCIVVGQDGQLYLEQGQVLSLPRDQILSIYPTEKSENLAFRLDTSTNDSTCFFDALSFEEQKIFVLLDGNLCQNFQVHKLNINGEVCTVEVGQKQATIKYLQTKKTISLPMRYSSYKVAAQGGYVYILLTDRLKQDLLLFNTSSARLSHISGSQISINGNKVFVTSELENISRHIVSEEYLLDDELKLLDKSISYQSRQITVQAKEVVPYAFLQALQVGDGPLASGYLDLPLRRQIDNPHLLSFFGDITAFFALDKQTYYVKAQSQSGIFKFLMQDNKISEIEKLD